MGFKQSSHSLLLSARVYALELLVYRERGMVAVKISMDILDVSSVSVNAQLGIGWKIARIW